MANVYMGTNIEEFIFDENATYENEISKEELNKFGVIECVHDNIEIAGYEIALENEHNFNMIYRNLMIEGFDVTASEYICESSDGKVKAFFKRMKELVQTFWSKIQGLFKKAMEKISYANATNKRFIKKYKGKDFDQLLVKVKGYDFSKSLVKDDMVFKKADDVLRNYEYILIDISSYKNRMRDLSDTDIQDKESLRSNNLEIKSEDMEDKLRGVLCGKSHNVYPEDYDKELKKAYFGSEDKIDMNVPKFSDLINDLETSKATIDVMKNAYDNSEHWVKYYLREIKRAENEAKKLNHENKLKYLSVMSRTMNNSLNILSKSLTVLMNALVTKTIQDKMMAELYIKQGDNK